MASSFKTLLSSDVTQTRTLLNEAIPITGTIVSGTYSDNNIKTYSHNMFQSVYDYPYASSSANHIFDLTFGYASGSGLSGSSSTDNAKKLQVYNQMAQVLAGFDTDQKVRLFDEDGQLAGGAKLRNCLFVNFSRLLVKDEIKKGSFSLQYFASGTFASPAGLVTIQDTNAQNEYRVNSPAGEYGILYVASTGTIPAGAFTAVSNAYPIGLIYYQAGVAVLSLATSSVTTSVSGATNQLFLGGATLDSSNRTTNALLTGSNINSIANAFRHRLYNVSFNNTTELNSTIYFCRANANDFNYSANPTYLSSSKIIVKNSTTDEPVAYATTVGLYSTDNELLAVAKLSEPIKKTPSTEFTLRVRLDY
jgi:hypothetical protein